MDPHAAAGPDLSQLKSRFLEALLNGNRREALRLLVDEGLQRGASVLDLQLRVVQEAQREIGELWQRNRISIADEHMATAISHLALAHLYQHAEPHEPRGRTVVVACVEGELHDFPARLVADALDLDGFGVRYLGANVPTDHLITVLERDMPDLLALSVTMSFNLPALQAAVERVRAVGLRLPIAAGGHAVRWSPQITETLGVDATGEDAAAMVRAARRLLEVDA